MNVVDSNEQRWGATALGSDTWVFSIWAPTADGVSVETGGRAFPATRAANGMFSVIVTARNAQPYTCLIDGVAHIDPAARWLEDGIGGPARFLPPVSRKVSEPCRDWDEMAILEVHIGTFTPEGTFAAAAARMAEIAALGVTAVEIMPVAAFAGARGWGYDGVFPFAVHSAYGTPQDLADMVDAIHIAGMLAILDVVYNHFGPEGCGVGAIAPPFFDKARDTPWGPGIDYTQPPVRQFFIQNAQMWIHEFGFDGLRLDAVHQINDPSPEHILDEMARTLRACHPNRPLYLIAEDERNLPGARESA
jgi:maltooligosyltrehalose trehalohydrolase